MKKYKPSNKVPTSGWQWLIMSSLLGSIAIGGISWAISQLIYLIIVFPAVMGAASGVVISGAVQRGKVRNPLVTILFSGLMGVGIYTSMFAFDYEKFRREVRAELVNNPQIEASQLESILQQFLKDKTGDQGLLGYIKYAAQQGVSIGKVGSSNPSHLNETMTWFYWLFEVLIMTGIGGFIGYQAATHPFSETDDEWYGQPMRIGTVKNQNYDNFIQAIDQNNLSLAGSFLNPLLPVLITHKNVLALFCQKSASSDVILQIDKIDFDSKGNIYNQCILQGIISASQYKQVIEKMRENFGLDQEENSQNLAFAQDERMIISPNSRWANHQLNPQKVHQLVEQISQYKDIKAAYLVIKDLQYLPDKPFYVLGIMRKGSWGLESENAPFKLLKRLGNELDLPDDTFILILNKQKELETAIKEVEGSLIYSRSR